MDTPQAPAAPDPIKTAQAQSDSNKATAVAQYGLNATNQVTPQGSLSYKQIGTWEDGTPRFEATQSLSPGEQSIYDINQQTRQNVGQIGADQSSRIASLLSTPFSYNNLPASVNNVQAKPLASTSGIQKSIGADDFSADRTKVEDAIYSRLNPQLERDRANLESSLINKGLRPGTEAWTQAIDGQNRASTDARMQAILAGGQEQSRLFGLDQAKGQFANSAQAQQYGQDAGNQVTDFNQQLANANLSNSQRAALAQQQLTERNQPINEITALMSGSQVSNPSFTNTPTPGVAPTDVIGAQQQSLNQQNIGYQGELSQNQALMSGLFGLGSAAIGAASGNPFAAAKGLKGIGGWGGGGTGFSTTGTGGLY